VLLTLRNGRTERLMVGQAVAQESGGYYASRGDASDIFIVSGMLQKTLTEAMAKLKPSPAPTTKAPAQP
jgi:hypothetical protein